jgi:XRE family transcriptional regulator, aerobic/anaerobic benzoate catabolism transcriptional regulator
MLWLDERAILHVGWQQWKAANRMKARAKANIANRSPAAASAPRVPGRVYLRMLGERVREARARRGMTRKILAKDSGVSERYLAQLEGGLGNISILLLRQIAQALDLRLETLIMEGPEPPVELMHTTELLRRLGPGEIRRAHQMLLKNFAGELGAADANARRSRIALIGLRGAGKSTLGAKLAKRLDVPFIELDRIIEQECGVTLSVIFDLYGQSGFRRLERQCLEQILERQPRFVLSTGGSLVSEHATFERLLTACFTVWLRATPEDHMQRVIAQGDMRPMAENRESMADLRRILSVREPLYGEADIAVDTSGRSLGESFDAILKAVQVTAS